MTVPGSPNPASAEIRTLADARLPPRVRNVLESLLRAASDEFERRLGDMLVEFEQQLFRLADHARNPTVESGYMQTLRTMRLNRADLIPRFMLGVEAGLASLHRAPLPGARSDTTKPATVPELTNLALVEDAEMDVDLILRDVAQRSAARASLPLHLLGQRFGVLGAVPAFDAERLPLGPWSLCTILQEASGVLQLPADAQQLLLRTFERRVMADYGQIAELFNAELAASGVLPALTYVPLRLRASAPPPDDDSIAKPRARGRNAAAKDAQAAGGRARPHTAWLGLDVEDGPVDGGSGFAGLQELLAGRRTTRAAAATQRSRAAQDASTAAAELATALAQLRPALGLAGGDGQTIDGLKRAVTLRLREEHGPEAELTKADSDTFDLLGMLYERVEREVRIDTLAAGLLKRLQLPVLHAALDDHEFFTRSHHPARQLLNTVAESGARWLDDNDIDPTLLQPIQRAVDHVVKHAHEDPGAFETSNRMLQQELELLARRSDMAERRHVEAARGKEKLEIAKRLAAETIAGMIGQRKPHKFVRALIEQAWADALTLTLLRHGDDSDEWRQMLETTRRIVTACCDKGAVPDPELATQVEAALSRVGYHGDEAAAISRRLASLREEDDGASRTELAAALKTRTRLGEGGGHPEKQELAPRTPEEQAQYERVRDLPFGTWIEFVSNQQGDVVRKRLSWYSKVTGHALFVNLRGQRVGEQSLDSLARMLARGQARVVTIERARLVDRAWQATLGTLRGLARRGGTARTGARA
jgi:hypothetical protein